MNLSTSYNSRSKGNTSSLLQHETLNVNIEIGINKFPYSAGVIPKQISFWSSDNRELIFGDFYADTNIIFVYSDTEYLDARIEIAY